MSHRLDPFFSPRSIAIVGASERGMYPAGVLRNLLDYGYSGEIYPVNPHRQTVYGLTCYPDITQTPQTPDLAVVVVPRLAVLPSLVQCVAKGVPAAVVITAGFAEADAEGKALQAELTDFARANPITIIGPNCAGLADMRTNAIATRLPVPPRPGPVSFVSQSGALMMALYGLFADRQIGMNRLVSLGNQVDVDLSEGLVYLAEDEHTHVIGAFIEGVQSCPAFCKGLRKALIAGKPLILLKSGRTESGQTAAATHTAALAGSANVFDAVCQQFGAIQVDDIRELIDTLHVAATFGEGLKGSGRVALVSQSGGLGSLSADLVQISGLTAPPLGKSLAQKIRALPYIPDFGVLANPTDVRGPSVIGEATRQTLAPFLEDPGTDAVILMLAKSAVREQDAETAQAIVEVAQGSDKPLCVVWVGQRHPVDLPDWPLGHEILRQAGIPLFEQPGDCVRALARLVEYWRFREAWLADPDVYLSVPATLTNGSAKAEPSILSARQTTALLEQYQIPMAPARLVNTPEEASSAAQKLGFPVALKALSPEQTHKTESGLLRLNLESTDDVLVAAREMQTQKDGITLEEFLVQKMISGGVEVILGISSDPQFGPVLAFGSGGILVEMLDDVVLRLPPITPLQARQMIRQTKVWRLLEGYRGNPLADIDALVELIVNLSRLAVDRAGDLHSLDLNPVIVLPAGQGAWAVDFRAFAKDKYEAEL